MSLFVCLHGLGSSARSFQKFAELLQQAQHDVLLHDFCGFGERVSAFCDENSLCSAIDELAEMLDDKEDIIIIGHSMGGAVAIELADKLAGRVKGVVSIEGNLISEDCGYLSRQIAESEDSQNLLDDVIAQMRGSEYEGWRLWADDAQNVSTNVMTAYAKELVDMSDSGALLKKFQQLPCKTLYLYGDEYLGHPVLEYLQDIPSQHLDAAGHFVMTDQPEECAKHILNFERKAI